MWLRLEKGGDGVLAHISKHRKAGYVHLRSRFEPIIVTFQRGPRIDRYRVVFTDIHSSEDIITHKIWVEIGCYKFHAMFRKGETSIFMRPEKIEEAEWVVEQEDSDDSDVENNYEEVD